MIELVIGGRADLAGDAEERPKGVEGIEAAVEAEDEFIEIRLEMLRTDAVMGAA